ncbi:MAG TPA: hypothetical protein VF450_24790, partial [Noviherbaspirillum sp.]
MEQVSKVATAIHFQIAGAQVRHSGDGSIFLAVSGPTRCQAIADKEGLAVEIDNDEMRAARTQERKR